MNCRQWRPATAPAVGLVHVFLLHHPHRRALHAVLPIIQRLKVWQRSPQGWFRSSTRVHVYVQSRLAPGECVLTQLWVVVGNYVAWLTGCMCCVVLCCAVCCVWLYVSAECVGRSKGAKLQNLWAADTLTHPTRHLRASSMVRSGWRKKSILVARGRVVAWLSLHLPLSLRPPWSR
eukprot:SAG31_NODE_715_length_12634_cov_5.289190_12_plen_176_part_00